MKNTIDIHLPDEFSTYITKNEVRMIADETLDILEISTYFVEIDFVSASVISDLNTKFRKIKKPTDVLSFPQQNPAESKINFLGSIVIAPEIVKHKKEAMDDVIKHGLLHLLGYDHETNEDFWNSVARKINCKL